MKQKTLALCLVLAMLFSMMPTTVLGADAPLDWLWHD